VERETGRRKGLAAGAAGVWTVPPSGWENGCFTNQTDNSSASPYESRYCRGKLRHPALGLRDASAYRESFRKWCWGMRAIVAIGALMMMCAPAFSQVLVNVFIPGRCDQFNVSGIKYPCKAAIYSHFKNGRIAFTFDTPHGAVTLSGASDSQIDPRRYILNIDTIRVGRGNASTQSYRSKGQCVLLAKDQEAKFVRSITCKASNGTETVNIKFTGTGRAERMPNLL